MIFKCVNCSICDFSSLIIPVLVYLLMYLCLELVVCYVFMRMASGCQLHTSHGD